MISGCGSARKIGVVGRSGRGPEEVSGAGWGEVGVGLAGVDGKATAEGAGWRAGAVVCRRAGIVTGAVEGGVILASTVGGLGGREQLTKAKAGASSGSVRKRQ